MTRNNNYFNQKALKIIPQTDSNLVLRTKTQQNDSSLKSSVQLFEFNIKSN